MKVSLYASLLLVTMLDLTLAQAAQGWEITPEPTISLLIPKEKPFWKNQKKTYTKLHEQRAIFVSVKESASEPGNGNSKKSEYKSSSKSKNDANKRMPNPKKQLDLKGVGLVNDSVHQVYSWMKNFSSWTQMSDYVESAVFDSRTNRLILNFIAYGFRARLDMDIFFAQDRVDEKKKAIFFSVRRGAFKEMRGALVVQKPWAGVTSSQGSEISLFAQMNYNKSPLPSFLLEFGLEVALQKMASRMRSFVEEKKRERENLKEKSKESNESSKKEL